MFLFFYYLKLQNFQENIISLCIQMMVVLCLMVFGLRTNSAIDPSSLSGLPKENIICSYFSTGFPYKGILRFLLIYHNIKLCYLRCVIYVTFFVNKSYFEKMKCIIERNIEFCCWRTKRVWVFLSLLIYYQKIRMKGLSKNCELVGLAPCRKYISVGPNFCGTLWLW